MGFELVTFRFVVNALTHCPTLLTILGMKIILDFIVYFDRKYSQYGGLPYPLKYKYKYELFSIASFQKN